MGQPIRIHWSSKEIILRLAESLVQGDALSDEVRATLGEAIERARPETSYDINFLPLIKIIDKYGTEEDRFHLRSVSWFEEWDLGIKRFADLNRASKGELLNGDFTYSLLINYPLSEGATFGIASSRARGVAAPLKHDPSDLILYALEVFGAKESARAFMVEDRQVNAYDHIQATIQERIFDQLIDLFRTSDGRIRIPPPPFADEFHEIMTRKLGIEVETIRRWESTPHWRSAVAAFFAEILARGTGSEELTPYSIAGRVRLRNRVETRRLRGDWYRALERESFDSSYLKQAVEQRFPKGSRERLRALAWLGHLDPGQDLKFELSELATMAEMLEEEINVFHEIAPGFEGEDFTDLLTPLAGSMDLEGVKKLLSYLPNGTSGFRKFKALNIFGWHVDEPANLARWIKERIEVNRKHESFDVFLSEMFGVSVIDFMAKTYRLENQHVDTRPLIDAVVRGFPKVLDEYPELGQSENGFSGIARGSSPAEEDDDVDDENGVGADGNVRDEEAAAVTAADASLKGAQMALPLAITKIVK